MIIYSMFLVIFIAYVIIRECDYKKSISDELKFLDDYNVHLSNVRHEYYRTGSVAEAAPELTEHKNARNRFEKLFRAVAVPVAAGGDADRTGGSVFLAAVLRIQQEISRERRYLNLARHRFGGMALTSVWPLATVPMIAYWAGSVLETLQAFYGGVSGRLILFALSCVSVLCFVGIDKLRTPFFIEKKTFGAVGRRSAKLPRSSIDREKDRLRRQDELKRFKYVIEMMKDIAGMGPFEVLESIEIFSEIYRAPVSKCLNEYAVDPRAALAELSTATGGEMSDLCEAFAAAQELGVTDAFDEISSQIEIVREEDENNRRIALDRDALTGEILAALPGILILFGYLIIPFLVKALALFNTYQESLQEFIG